MPSLDEMKELAHTVKEVLTKDGRFEDVEVLEFEPGADIPIAFEHSGENYVLELNVL